MPAPSILNVKVGAATLSLDGDNVGHTLDGSEVSYEPIYHRINVDLYGEMTAEMVLRGQKMTAKLIVAESTIANILNAVAHGDDQTDYIGIGSKAGALASDVAKELVLHPNENAVGDRSLDVVMWKAVSAEPVTLPFKNDGESALEITFEAIIDESKSNGQYLGLIGDSAA